MGWPTINYAFLVSLLAYLAYVNFINWKVKLLVLFAGWLIAGGQHILYLCYHTAGRDLRLLLRGIPIVLALVKIKRGQMTVPKVFRRNLPERSEKVMFFNDTSQLTFSEVEELSNRMGNLLLGLGFTKGDTLALFMENRLEYVPLWLGMAKVGVIPALINYNLKSSSLLHCIRVAGCKSVVCSQELLPAVLEIGSDFKSEEDFKIFCYDDNLGEAEGVIDLKKELKASSPDPEPVEVADSIQLHDPLLYIYTSGTTGMPKAVVIKHLRQLFVMVASHIAIGLSSDDVIYCHLPLYHSSGGQIATASAIMYGTKTFIKKKFSASAFWKDCHKHNITATQYIGEICRYLLATPSIPEEKQHKVQRMFGNGLRPQVWTEFVTRFNIKNISEFYGSTEGNSNIVNNENRVGSVGFIGVIEPQWLQELLLPLMIIRVEPATGEPIRNQDGFCIRCEPGEAGEFIGKIVKGDPVKEFNGYKSKKDTEKKILYNVLRRGDSYFRSGDILVMDKFGWIYFKDRAGDTFRWKGENVSTAEVEVTVSKVLDGAGTVAYGVEIPGVEGKAGMVCIQGDKSSVNLEAGLTSLINQLPGYAIPMFYRFSQDLDMTGTYKLKKMKLQKEGFDISLFSDTVLFLDIKQKSFQVLDRVLHQDILEGRIKL